MARSRCFETYFRRFFRGEDRSNLQSALFNVPGRLVVGCWADYENIGASSSNF